MLLKTCAELAPTRTSSTAGKTNITTRNGECRMTIFLALTALGVSRWVATPRAAGSVPHSRRLDNVQDSASRILRIVVRIVARSSYIFSRQEGEGSDTS